jgi:glycolate oxidase iron-sulfur subunit
VKPEEQKLFLDCVHCGLCLSACPTYRELGTEMDSPRGRIYLMRALAEGRLGPEEETMRHLDLCLGCRACETACPSGVQYGRLLEASRADLEPHRPVSLVKTALVEHIFPYPGRTRVALALAGLGRMVSGWLPGSLRVALELAPRSAGAGWQPSITLPRGQRRYRVGFMPGCIASVVFPYVNDATIAVLAHNGCEVVVPAGQGCCGALHVHNGSPAADLALRNIEAFKNLDVVITNAAGCGSTLKEYDHLVDDDGGFSKKVRDISEWLVEIGFEKPVGRLEATVTYQDACHLAHAQKIRHAPRELLASIPGLRLVELEESDTCCGGAGMYNILNPDMSERLLAHKVRTVTESGATIVVAANPGCLLQMERGLRGKGLRFAHPVELLAEAYGLLTGPVIC